MYIFIQQRWRKTFPFLTPDCVWTLYYNSRNYLIKTFFSSYILGGFPGGSPSKESACNAGDLGLIPEFRRSPGEGKGYPLQYSGLENSMDCIVRGVTKSHIWLSDFDSFHYLHLVCQSHCNVILLTQLWVFVAAQSLMFKQWWELTIFVWINKCIDFLKFILQQGLWFDQITVLKIAYIVFHIELRFFWWKLYVLDSFWNIILKHYEMEILQIP